MMTTMTTPNSTSSSPSPSSASSSFSAPPSSRRVPVAKPNPASARHTAPSKTSAMTSSSTTTTSRAWRTVTELSSQPNRAWWVSLTLSMQQTLKAPCWRRMKTHITDMTSLLRSRTTKHHHGNCLTVLTPSFETTTLK